MITLDQYNEIVDKHAKAVYRYAFRRLGNIHEAEDLTQEVFYSLWKAMDVFTYEKENDPMTLGWLYTVTKRRVADWWDGPNPKFPILIGDTLEKSYTPPVADFDFSQELQAALLDIDPKFREPLLMMACMDMTVYEIADLLKIPLGTVLSRLSRDRKSVV